MSFSTMLSSFKHEVWESTKQIGKSVRLRILGDEINSTVVPQVQNLSLSGRLNMLSIGRIIANGLKQFNLPTGSLIEQLEQTDINVPFRDYKQPYDDVVIQFPETISRIIDNGYGRTHKVDFVILTNNAQSGLGENQNILIANVVFNDYQCFTVPLYSGLNDNNTIEEILMSGYDGVVYNDLKIGVGEKETAYDSIRAAINYVLLIGIYGFVNMGVNRDLQAQLQRSVKKKPHSASLASQLFLLPQICKLKLKMERRKIEVVNEGITTVRPHWRRGHWRNQHYGIKGLEVKLIWIEPVLVNKDRYDGDIGNTVVIYKS